MFSHQILSGHSAPEIRSSSDSFEVLRLSQVIQKVGLSRSTIYAEMKAGRFPKQVQLTSRRCVGWISTEVDAHIQARIAESRNLVNGGL